MSNDNKAKNNKKAYAAIGIIIVIIVAIGIGVYASGVLNTKTTPSTLPAAEINSGGSTFAAPIVEDWATQFYSLYPNVQITYTGVGSGTGKTYLFDNTYQFAGSDSPLTAAQIAQYDIVQIPETCGGVTVAYNLQGVANLNLTANVIAEIFQQNITMWNDPRITALNPNVTLPDTTIIVVHRSDSSGTTQIFSTFLQNASTAWVLGAGSTINWPTSPNKELGGPGNSGVESDLLQTPDSIGYVEFWYVSTTDIPNTNTTLPYANVQDQEGQFVTPSLTSIGNAVTEGAPLLSTNITASIVNLPGSDVYPISSFTYFLVYQNMTFLGYNDATDIASFIWWAINGGQQYCNALYYPTLPSSVVTLDENILNTLTYNNTAVPIVK